MKDVGQPDMAGRKRPVDFVPKGPEELCRRGHASTSSRQVIKRGARIATRARCREQAADSAVGFRCIRAFLHEHLQNLLGLHLQNVAGIAAGYLRRGLKRHTHREAAVLVPMHEYPALPLADA